MKITSDQIIEILQKKIKKHEREMESSENLHAKTYISYKIISLLELENDINFMEKEL